MDSTDPTDLTDLAASIPSEGLPLLTGEQAGVADRAAVEAGDSWDGLLARAGAALARGVVEVLRARTGGVYGRRVLVVAGKGDNGGDGWVCAARLRERGVAVTVVAVHGVQVEMSDHSARARAAWLDSGGRVVDGIAALGPLEGPDAPDVVVDCVLGTGARGAPRDEAADAVDALRWLQVAAGVVACDVPSGVDAATGAVADPRLTVDADLTVTFGAAKRGLLLQPGAGHTGALRVADLGPHWSLPAADGDDVQAGEVWYATGDAAALPTPWAADDDKRTRGVVAVLAGSQRYGGAAALCSAAAVRTGAGLVTLATTASPTAVLATEPGVMVVQLPAAGDDVGGPSPDGTAAVLELVADADAVVVGPGLGHAPATREVVEEVLDAARGRVVVLDADGLNVFRHDAAALADVGAELVLTPHVRELARLLERDPDDVTADRAAAARELAEVTGAVVVAKGPGTLVVGPGRPTAVITSGGPALGSGGTGDVLAGMLGARLAADRPRARLVHPAVVGTAHLHGLAGDRAGARAGGRATASDLLEVLPDVLADLTARRRVGTLPP